MCIGGSDRAMDQGPTPINPVRQKSCILILRLHDHAVALEGAEIFCERKSYARSSAGVRRTVGCGIPGNTGSIAISSGKRICFKKIFEDGQIFLKLFFHLFFQNAFIHLKEIDRIGLNGYLDLRAAVGRDPEAIRSL